MSQFNQGSQSQNRVPQSIGFLLLDNFTLISLASAVEPLRMANRVVGQPVCHVSAASSCQRWSCQPRPSPAALRWSQLRGSARSPIRSSARDQLYVAHQSNAASGLRPRRW